MKKRFTKVLVLLTLIAAMVTMMAMPALAADPVTVLDGQVTVSSSDATKLSVSGTTVTGTAKGGLMSQKTATFTVKNTSGSTAKITFDYSISKASSHSESAASGSKSMV